MAFFSSGSRALVEILTRMQSAERPMPVDHTFFEFGSIRYHVQASASDPENVYLSISTPPLSLEASPSSSSSGLPEATLQETRTAYREFAEVVEPPREGYLLTLKLDFSGLARPKDRVKAINQVSLLPSVVLSSQLRDMLGSLGPSGTMRLVCSQREPFFVSRTAEEIHAVFPMRFRDDTDLAIATSFFQELQELGGSLARAPRCSWSPIPPPELRGEHVHRLTTNGGFVSFGVLSRHVRGRKRAAKTAWILLNFQAYVKYHIKCTRSHIQSRMRQRLEALTEVIQDASLRGGNDDRTRSQESLLDRVLLSSNAREAGLLVACWPIATATDLALIRHALMPKPQMPMGKGRPHSMIAAWKSRTMQAGLRMQATFLEPYKVRMAGTTANLSERAAVVKKRRKSKRRLISFAKASSKLQKGFRAILDKVKRLRLRIRVKDLDRLRRQCRCFAAPKLPVPPRRKEYRYRKLASHQ